MVARLTPTMENLMTMALKLILNQNNGCKRQLHPSTGELDET